MSLTVDTGTEELLCQIEDRVAKITLNRPEKRNALSDNLTPALRQVLLDLDTRQDVGCLVITGAGSAFCAGGDIGGMGAGSADPDAPKPTIQERTRTLQHKHDTLTPRLFEHSKPTIAALPGVAAGAGFCIALACDIRIAAASAFVTTAYRNIGFSGDYGGSWLLNQLVGPAKTKELFYTARRVQSDEALALGIFNQVVPDDELTDATLKYAMEIAERGAFALASIKAAFNARHGGVGGLSRMAHDLLLRGYLTTDESKELSSAFAERRSPDSDTFGH